jgi:uncharacterized damage-inducible protein DinB
MTWTAPPVDERTEPGFTLPEREQLDAWVDYHRATLLWKCAGLTAEQLKERAVPPSRLSLLGLVRHMVEVERWWFRMHAAAEDVTYEYSVPDPAADIEFPNDADAERDLAPYRSEIETARAAVANLDLDHVVASRGHRKDVRFSLRWIYLHMIEEYARHNGHADLLRERIDGVTGD